MDVIMRRMSTKVKDNRKTDEYDQFGWDAMIRDAKKKIEDLKFSIEVFERRKAAGESWPGSVASQQPTRSAPTGYLNSTERYTQQNDPRVVR
jgi:hypothetical protein